MLKINFTIKFSNENSAYLKYHHVGWQLSEIKKKPFWRCVISRRRCPKVSSQKYVSFPWEQITQTRTKRKSTNEGWRKNEKMLKIKQRQRKQTKCILKGDTWITELGVTRKTFQTLATFCIKFLSRFVSWQRRFIYFNF